MNQSGWYIAKSEGNEQAGPYGADAFREALLSGAVKADDQVWRDGMDGWENAAPFLWFASRGDASSAEPEPAPTADAKPRPAPDPSGGDALGRLERPEAKVIGKVLGRTISVSEPDLADFATVNAEPYLAFRQKLVNKGGRVWLSWSWPAFFVPLAWFAYRRLFGWLFAFSVGGTVASVLALVVPSLLGVFGFAVFVVPFFAAMIAKRLVLVRADRAAALADTLDLQPGKRAALLGAEGGVSRAAAWAGGIVTFILITVMALHVLSTHVSGFPKVWPI